MHHLIDKAALVVLISLIVPSKGASQYTYCKRDIRSDSNFRRYLDKIIVNPGVSFDILNTTGRAVVLAEMGVSNLTGLSIGAPCSQDSVTYRLGIDPRCAVNGMLLFS